MAFNFKKVGDSLDEAVNEGVVSWYTGNLNKYQEYFHLKANHLLLRDCDKLGELSSKEKYVFVQYIPCKNTNGDMTFILNCRTCNINAISLEQSMKNSPTLSSEFIQKCNT